MTNNAEWQLNVLYVRQRLKSIPYGPGKHEHGENFGYQRLKYRPELVAQLPEVRNDDSLRSLLEWINSPDSAFWSVGCVSAEETNDRRHCVVGYVEMAFNDKLMIADAQNYFPIFYHFETNCRQQFDGISFRWELAPASINDGDAIAEGFTCTVFINTPLFSEKRSSRSAWARALALLQHHLAGYAGRSGDPLYTVDS